MRWTRGGYSIFIRGLGCLLRILQRTPERYQDPVLGAWFQISFTPTRYQLQNNTFSPASPGMFFQLDTVKGTVLQKLSVWTF